jgi:glycosyltransferase involved in cell wall biosynthesis
MKVIIICSFNKGFISPFIIRQAESIQKIGIDTEYFLICGKGIIGYISNINRLKNQIIRFKPDLIHAHYGLSGLLAVLLRRVPVITSFHGSDINYLKNRLLSKIAKVLSAWSIYISAELGHQAGARKSFSIIPCGVDLSTFYPFEKSEARQKMGLKLEDKIVLFSGSFNNTVKNYPLAKDSLRYLNCCDTGTPPITIIELKGYSPDQVGLLLNACDLALLTSFSEGSPNFIKEAMACNRPIVSTDVGDVKELIEGLPGCFIAKNNPEDLADKISQALDYNHSVGARQRIIDRGLEINEIARKIVAVYEQVLHKKSKNTKH